ncbi:T9SS type A sorting domain-containing protein [Balneolaceae bacterium ANBcel3]|nr:T9SS type A sorting domain-containing protein [Balneolaceae bacterium ANBcel3]
MHRLLLFVFVFIIPGLALAQSDIPSERPVKCMTPYLLHYEQDASSVPPAIRKKLQNRMVEADEPSYQYYSESGKFIIDYYLSGNHAVPSADETGTGIPDYVEWAAEYADYSYRVQVEELGFIDPTKHQGRECGNRVGNWTERPITVYLRNLGNVYGEFRGSEPFAFYVHHTFQDFPPNEDPEGQIKGALKVTVAHELKHVIQYASSCFNGEAGSTHWIEMDATMMENIVYPEVNDYYNYITGTFGIFGNPARSTPVAYDHVTWMLYYAEYIGMDFWVDTWDVIHQNQQIRMDHAMNRIFDERHGGNPQSYFTKHKTRNYLWHAVSGNRTAPGYGFSESTAYPNARFAKKFDRIPEGTQENIRLDQMSASFYRFIPDIGQIGNLRLVANHTNDNVGFGVLAYKNDNTVEEWLPESPPGGVTTGESPFSMEETDSLIIVVVNAMRFSSTEIDFALEVLTIPEQIALMQNYPNPFGSTGVGSGTNFRFSTPREEHIEITVYDVVGRRVATVYDELTQPGMYDVPFNAAGLSSGVYLYRLRAPGVHKTGKMTLIH